MIVGLVGLIGSGKDTAADFLVDNYNFQRESFAGHLKDIVSIVFGWDRDLLEGRTAESRYWREQVDPWWSNRLNMNVTPRWVLQYWGTEVLRKNFHDDIWIASLEKKITNKGGNIIITDCRFPNEIAVFKKLQAKICRVIRGPDPEWFKYAKIFMAGHYHPLYEMSKDFIEQAKIHASEYSWANTDFDMIIDNNRDISNLYRQLMEIVK
jgi:hypothetical protein